MSNPTNRFRDEFESHTGIHLEPGAWQELLPRLTKALTDGGNSRQQPHQPNQKATQPISLISYENIESKQVQWLWRGYLARGVLNLIQGDPGKGKSQLMVDIAARVTRGLPMPDGSPGVEGSVLFVAGEDAHNFTMKPRLEAADADLSRIRFVDPAQDIDLTLPDHIPPIRQAVEQYNEEHPDVPVIFVVIDSEAEFAGDLDMNRASTARKFHKPLHKLAEDFGCAVAVVRHLNKGRDQSALQRGSGSISGVAGKARIVLHAAPDPTHPDDSQYFVLSVAKCNLAKEADSLIYCTAGVTLLGGKEPIETSRIEWTGKHSMRADQLVRASEATDDMRKTEEAEEWLRDLLEEKALLKMVIDTKAKLEGISVTGALRRASDRMRERGELIKRQLPPDKKSWWWLTSGPEPEEVVHEWDF
jgi:RecA-family ATPase